MSVARRREVAKEDASTTPGRETRITQVIKQKEGTEGLVKKRCCQVHLALSFSSSLFSTRSHDRKA